MSLQTKYQLPEIWAIISNQKLCKIPSLFCDFGWLIAGEIMFEKPGSAVPSLCPVRTWLAPLGSHPSPHWGDCLQGLVILTSSCQATTRWGTTDKQLASDNDNYFLTCNRRTVPLQLQYPAWQKYRFCDPRSPSSLKYQSNVSTLRVRSFFTR